MPPTVLLILDLLKGSITVLNRPSQNLWLQRLSWSNYAGQKNLNSQSWWIFSVSTLFISFSIMLTSDWVFFNKSQSSPVSFPMLRSSTTELTEHGQSLTLIEKSWKIQILYKNAGLTYGTQVMTQSSSTRVLDELWSAFDLSDFNPAFLGDSSDDDASKKLMMKFIFWFSSGQLELVSAVLITFSESKLFEIDASLVETLKWTALRFMAHKLWLISYDS